MNKQDDARELNDLALRKSQRNTGDGEAANSVLQLSGRREAVEGLRPWLEHGPRCGHATGATTINPCRCGLSAKIDELTRG